MCAARYPPHRAVVESAPGSCPVRDHQIDIVADLFIPSAHAQASVSLFDLGIVIYEKPRDGWFSYFRTLKRTEVK